MSLQAVGLSLVLCREIRRDELGNISLINLATTIHSNSIPKTLGLYFALTGIKYETECFIEVTDGATNEVIFKLTELKIKPLPHRNAVMEITLMLEEFPAVLSKPGVYIFRIIENQQIILQRPLIVEGDTSMHNEERDSLKLTLHSSKETDNKLRWDIMYNDTIFSLYIPKWRIPEPPPEFIYVQILPALGAGKIASLSKYEVNANSTIRSNPIYALVKKNYEATKTVRYTPIANRDDWEIGEPYIPIELTLENQGLEQKISDRLLVVVKWDLKSRGNFRTS